MGTRADRWGRRLATPMLVASVVLFLLAASACSGAATDTVSDTTPTSPNPATDTLSDTTPTSPNPPPTTKQHHKKKHHKKQLIRHP